MRFTIKNKQGATREINIDFDKRQKYNALIQVAAHRFSVVNVFAESEQEAINKASEFGQVIKVREILNQN